MPRHFVNGSMGHNSSFDALFIPVSYTVSSTPEIMIEDTTIGGMIPSDIMPLSLL
jgi:hypothetical protein